MENYDLFSDDLGTSVLESLTTLGDADPAFVASAMAGNLDSASGNYSIQSQQNYANLNESNSLQTQAGLSSSHIYRDYNIHASAGAKGSQLNSGSYSDIQTLPYCTTNYRSSAPVNYQPGLIHDGGMLSKSQCASHPRNFALHQQENVFPMHQTPTYLPATGTMAYRSWTPGHETPGYPLETPTYSQIPYQSNAHAEFNGQSYTMRSSVPRFSNFQKSSLSQVQSYMLNEENYRPSVSTQAALNNPAKGQQFSSSSYVSHPEQYTADSGANNIPSHTTPVNPSRHFYGQSSHNITQSHYTVRSDASFGVCSQVQPQNTISSPIPPPSSADSPSIILNGGSQTKSHAFLGSNQITSVDSCHSRKQSSPIVSHSVKHLPLNHTSKVDSAALPNLSSRSLHASHLPTFTPISSPSSNQPQGSVTQNLNLVNPVNGSGHSSIQELEKMVIPQYNPCNNKTVICTISGLLRQESPSSVVNSSLNMTSNSQHSACSSRSLTPTSISLSAIQSSPSMQILSSGLLNADTSILDDDNSSNINHENFKKLDDDKVIQFRIQEQQSEINAESVLNKIKCSNNKSKIGLNKCKVRTSLNTKKKELDHLGQSNVKIKESEVSNQEIEEKSYDIIKSENIDYYSESPRFTSSQNARSPNLFHTSDSYVTQDMEEQFTSKNKAEVWNAFSSTNIDGQEVSSSDIPISLSEKVTYKFPSKSQQNDIDFQKPKNCQLSSELLTNVSKDSTDQVSLSMKPQVHKLPCSQIFSTTNSELKSLSDVENPTNINCKEFKNDFKKRSDKKKKEPKEKKPKEPKDKKPKNEKIPKQSKKKNEFKQDKTLNVKKKVSKNIVDNAELETLCDNASTNSIQNIEQDTVIISSSVLENSPDITKKSRKEKVPKMKVFTSKKKPSKTLFSINQKRKRHHSNSEASELEGTPPPSPQDGEGALKRRSGRFTKRKKYIDDFDIASEEEFHEDKEKNEIFLETEEASNKSVIKDSVILHKPNFVYVNTTDDDSMVIQSILAMRIGIREIMHDEDENEDDLEMNNTESTKYNYSVNEISLESDESKNIPKEVETVEVEEFLIKYKNFSYLHCEWHTEEELYKGDHRVVSKIKRFKQKMSHSKNIFDFLDEEPFNPDYIEVDRVLDVTETEDPHFSKIVKHYLVKWRSLPYEDSTWELEEDVDPLKIEQFLNYQKAPNKDQLKIKKRPKADAWKKIDKTFTYKNDNTLREYQLEGLNWLLFSWHNGQNCILADEMGLGKTIQSIAFLSAVYDFGIHGPFLVIAPLSTIPNWQREFEAWTNINVIVYHGTSTSRNMIQEYEMYFKNIDNKRIKDVYKFEVMITTFEMIITDCMELCEIPWRCCIIDEAHRLKNKNCKLLEGLRLLNVEHRVLLSGTPLQNSVHELFSLLNFLEPVRFAKAEEFLQEFGDLKSEAQVQKLQALLKPMMLRRLKVDVEKSIAPKEETVIEVELTNIQKKYYRAILEKNFSFLAKGTTSTNVPNLMNTMMELRKCCIHPFLINGAEEQIQEEWKQQHSGPDFYFQSMIHSSGKLVLIDKLLPKLKQNGHRVLIFSQMVKCLDILEDYLIYRKYPFERIDGRIRGNLRQAAIDRFCRTDSDRFVFLLCTKAGGLGINLTAADTVIIYDSDWNPQNDLQAQARCHRIGQCKMVKVYRLICRNTYEREMFDRASLKLGLDKAVLQSMNSSQGDNNPNVSQQLSKKEIEDLLKKGAYGALMDDDSAGDKFCEEDIDLILQRRTQVITLENEKGSTFSKASFSSANTRSDIDIDDPDFWQKWAKKADFDLESLSKQNELIVEEPRRRTQTRRFGNDEAVMEISDLDTSSDSDDEKGKVSSRRTRSGKFGRRSRNGRMEEDRDYVNDESEIIYGKWSRNEFFKIEKGLLTFGWGRWQEILALGQFRKSWKETDAADCARIILLYCLDHYHGDDKIKSFIWDLITPCPDGMGKVTRLSAPVPRGRKGKKKQKEAKIISAHMEDSDWSKDDKYDPSLYIDNSYRKHLNRHANKVRMLYYIKQEILGDLVKDILEGKHANALSVYPPIVDQPPTFWWDVDADRSLLVGVYKHGYERFNVMRLDPLLCFFNRCGPPDGAALLAEINAGIEEELEKSAGFEEEDDPSSPLMACSSDDIKLSSSDDVKSFSKTVEQEIGKLPFPSTSEINTRLRRLITQYQRSFKKQELKQAARAKRLERREKMEAVIRERENKKIELQQRRWSRREEAEFYRCISSFGVEFNRKTNQYDWSRFRQLSHLERKYDDTITEYFRGFYAMCKRMCGMKLTAEEEILQLVVEPISEERARRILDRIDLLNKVREEILPQKNLEECLKLCKSSMDMPDWWIPGKHDKDLLLGVTKHGFCRTDYYILNDPDLSFKEVLRRHMSGEPLISAEEKLEWFKEEEEDKMQKKDFSTVVDSSAANSDFFNNMHENVEQNANKTKMNCTEAISDFHELNEVNQDEDSIKNNMVHSSQIKQEKNTELSEEFKNKNKEAFAKPYAPSIELPQPLLSLVQMDEAMARQGFPFDPEFLTDTSYMFPNYVSPIRWPKDKVLQIRVEHICHAVEKGKWPVTRYFSAFGNNDGSQQDLSRQTTPEITPRRDSSTSASIVEEGETLFSSTPHFDNMPKRRGRRRKVDLETERAKLRALLSHNLQSSLAYAKQFSHCDMNEDNVSDDSRSASVALLPPPAHQPRSTASLSSNLAALGLPANLGVTISPSGFGSVDLSCKPHGISVSVVPTSERKKNAIPIDLSSISKKSEAVGELNNDRALDLQLKKKENLSELYTETRKGKFQSNDDDGKEKKRRKLDEIVLGLSAAKCQSHPTVSVSPSGPSVSKLSTKLPDFSRANITITPIPASNSSIQPSSNVPNRINKDLKMIDAKVSKWLTDQAIHLNERPSSPSWDKSQTTLRAPHCPSSRRPRVDPMLLDWNKLSGEEKVPVVDRSTGRRVTGSRAPQLRNLAHWLLENPSYDVDPKWAELVRSKGNLPDQLQKRISHECKKGPGRPPLLISSSNTSPTNSAISSIANNFGMGSLSNLPASLFGGMPFGTLDPKNPLFMSFSGLPGLGLANPLFPSFGLPSLPLGHEVNLSVPELKDSKDKRRIPNSNSTSTFPYIFPTAGFMYNPLTVGSLNSIGMPSGMTPPLTSNLINGIATNAVPTTTSSKSTKTSLKQKNPEKSHSEVISHTNSDEESMKSLMGDHDDELPLDGVHDSDSGHCVALKGSGYLQEFEQTQVVSEDQKKTNSITEMKNIDNDSTNKEASFKPSQTNVNLDSAEPSQS